jgi:hypothetical protein
MIREKDKMKVKAGKGFYFIIIGYPLNRKSDNGGRE